MAKGMEKNAYVHFVDERDFKEVSVVGKRKSKKNRQCLRIFFNSRQCGKFEPGRRIRNWLQQWKYRELELALSLMKTEMKVTKKVAATLKNSQKTKETSKTFVPTVSHEILFNLPREPSVGANFFPFVFSFSHLLVYVFFSFGSGISLIALLC